MNTLRKVGAFLMNGYPKKQGLYNPIFEHDACGIGVIVNIKGEASHKIIEQAVEININLSHRGGVGSESDTGDGAGILIKIPDKFMRKVCACEGVTLPQAGSYGVGMLFCSPDLPTRQESVNRLEQIIAEEGMKLIFVRDVPCCKDCIGRSALIAKPYILQVFVEKPDGDSADDFERRMYIAMKRSEREIRYKKTGGDSYFYFASFSARTIVYKGMLTPKQVSEFYLDLKDVDIESSIALVHSRFSTNTFPSWERAHPNRYIIHNGEINTIRGNVNWVKARQALLKSEKYPELDRAAPIINEDGSDSAMLDNFLQFLNMSGISLPHAVMMTIPEPWERDKTMNRQKRGFYLYSSRITESWDGPAAIAFTDGRYVGATLDRNGLRPARYIITKDGLLILASETGVVDIPSEDVLQKERLHPGRMLLIDTEEGKVIGNDEIKKSVYEQKDYDAWVKKNIVGLEDIESSDSKEDKPELTEEQEKMFGYTWEDINTTIKETVIKGDDPISAMGNDVPLAVLSDKPQLMFNYFKQLFAQVTNPPIDAMREKNITSSVTLIGGEKGMLLDHEASGKRIYAETPVLSDEQLSKLKSITTDGFKSAVVPMLFEAGKSGSLEKSLHKMFARVEKLIKDGCNIIILSDKGADKSHAPIPSLLACSGLHHYLIRKGNRMKVSIVVESAQIREVHHFALLLGYGADAVNAYMAYAIAEDLSRGGEVDFTPEEAVSRFITAMTSGIVKTMSKMGISTVQSYKGAQIFEALGISMSVIDEYFTGTTSRIGGLEIDDIEKEVMKMHSEAFSEKTPALKTGGNFKWRASGEYHMYNPQTIYKLQRACRENDYKLYNEYAEEINTHDGKLCTLRSMMNIKTIDKPIALDSVEPVESIVKRFKTGAMSYGSISLEAHECLAAAMNRLGGKSNSGEGGEIPERYEISENGDNLSSAIKQVASGRFGVHIHYLSNAREIQIKIAQGAKPGEGGHLPGKKVYPWIAKARHSTPGVGLISPPPHHDIYSIEDLAELIFDLKNANPDARISVKLVSEAGVGTIAVGAAKGLADVIAVSGYDGGTGAAPRTAIRHAGLPWELGVAEVHQSLLMNNLRSRVSIETDGKLMTGRDVAIAALLGAEEYAFATAPLVVMGCVMMRVCNLDTCPVGVATQNPELRKNFSGKPEYVENFMRFIAEDLREWMAKIGVRTVNELIGHVEFLEQTNVRHEKARRVDLTSVLYQPKICSNEKERYCTEKQDHKLELTLDKNTIIRLCAPAINSGKHIEAKLKITNKDRAVGAMLSSAITKAKGADGLPDESIRLHFIGSAGQSFGAFLAHGVTMYLEGDSNDYIGKGLSGGRIIVNSPQNADFIPEDNVIVGNVAFYGAVFGEAYIRGKAGERFCVRNSGITAVVEGIGDHGCEYMTGGRVVILGECGKNFAAGMSGGVAYVYDKKGDFASKCNTGLVSVEDTPDEESLNELKGIIENHKKYTGSDAALRVLSSWETEKKRFVRVIPRDYKKVVTIMREERENGASYDDAAMTAFQKLLNA